MYFQTENKSHCNAVTISEGLEYIASSRGGRECDHSEVPSTKGFHSMSGHLVPLGLTSVAGTAADPLNTCQSDGHHRMTSRIFSVFDITKREQI